MKKVKLVKIAVLGAAAILGITGCNKQPSEQPLDAKWLALGQFQVGEHDSAWDAALDDNGNVIAESHHLDVEDVLYGLKIPYECEDINTDED